MPRNARKCFCRVRSETAQWETRSAIDSFWLLACRKYASAFLTSEGMARLRAGLPVSRSLEAAIRQFLISTPAAAEPLPGPAAERKPITIVRFADDRALSG